MILQALTAYYEALLAQGKLSAPGWADAFPVSYELEVDDRGALIDVIDCPGKHAARQENCACSTADARAGACKTCFRRCGKLSLRQRHLSARRR